MNDEIKEILEMLRKYGSTNDKVLLDYITNLEDTLIDKQECIDAYSEIINNKDEKITNLQQIEQDHKQANAVLMQELTNLEIENEILKQNINKVINDINRYLEGRKIINDITKYYYTNEFYKKPIKSNIAYLFNDYLEYLLNILQGINEGE